MKKEKISGEKIEKEMEELREKEKRILKQWNPEIVMVTVVGILLILGLTAFSGFAINTLKDQLETVSTQLSQAVQPATYVAITANETACVRACEVNVNLSIPIEIVSGVSDCSTTGKVKILAFYSPTCPYCEAQRPILDSLKTKYGEKLDLSYVCMPVHSGDEELCQENKENMFLPYLQGLPLIQQYQQSIGGTPTLIIDCQFKRVGSYALKDQSMGTNVEEEDLETMISAFVS